MSISNDLFSHVCEYAASMNAECSRNHDEVTLEIGSDQIIQVMRHLRDNPEFRFEQLMDLAGVDYLEFGKTEWKTEEATTEGFSRGSNANTFGRFRFDNFPAASYDGKRYAVVYHLLSLTLNHRMRVRAYCDSNEFPVIASVVGIWASANWFEREAFDLFGIVFEGHPDLRRILTDYGFIGHPMRKDFPLIGHVEMRYDPTEGRVVYEPVSIEPRVLVPKVIRANKFHSTEEDAGDS